ncbi:MAG: 2-(1,2-epoxy-1,2-dihydrophenyl)acetyl-CoA isomerase, partial [Alphaproteobacteria bacterium]|nr:2-(1,2-epoxy-1,2-dihydrophenyl)acetyl-CoA isomerase [Alphaproteobacteria bacterium]
LNAIDTDMLEALIAALEAAERDDAVRVIVLRGAGRSFCAGADIGQMLERTPADWERIVDRYLDPVRRIALGDKPVIARLHGDVFGGGLGLAMACDFRIATDTSRFCAPFIKLALAGCDMSAGYYLPRLVGLSMATDMMMTGRVVKADEAARSGLVTRIVPEAELDATVDQLARGLARGARGALAVTKRAIRRSRDRDIESEFDYEVFVQVQCLQSPDHREGVAAFREKRPPRFAGAPA